MCSTLTDSTGPVSFLLCGAMRAPGLSLVTLGNGKTCDKLLWDAVDSLVQR